MLTVYLLFRATISKCSKHWVRCGHDMSNLHAESLFVAAAATIAAVFLTAFLDLHKCLFLAILSKYRAANKQQ